MASRPTESTEATFALQELAACWDQCSDALARGDLDQIAALLDIADRYAKGLAPASEDSVTERALRDLAMAARARLEHGMRSGLEGVRKELGNVRKGGRALHGYKDATHGVGSRVTHNA